MHFSSTSTIIRESERKVRTQAEFTCCDCEERCDLKKIATFVEQALCSALYRAGKLLSLGISSSELEKRGDLTHSH